MIADDYPGLKFAFCIYAKLSTGHVCKGGVDELPMIITEMKRCIEANTA